jgi:hypothetical protein
MRSSVYVGLLLVLLAFLQPLEPLVVSANPGGVKVQYMPLFYAEAPTQKGVTQACDSPTLCVDIARLGAMWTHNWSLRPPRCSGVDGVPMLADDNASYAFLAGRATIPSGAWRVQLWNEPDLIEPIGPDQGARLFRAMEPQLAGYSLVAPVPSEANTAWLSSWVKAYEKRYGCKPDVDVIAFHCYAQRAHKCIALGQQAVVWAKEWGADEVWCTEFAFFLHENWQAEASRFVDWMEGEPMVTRWAWYDLYGGPAPLIDAQGLTMFGAWYAAQ